MARGHCEPTEREYPTIPRSIFRERRVEIVGTSAAEKAAYDAGLETATKLAKIGGFSLEYSTMRIVQDALRAYRRAVTAKGMRGRVTPAISPILDVRE